MPDSLCMRVNFFETYCKAIRQKHFLFLADLYGLVLFLGVDPYWVKHWWDQLLYQPYCRKNPRPLYSLIAKIMWRSAKKDVIDQVNKSFEF